MCRPQCQTAMWSLCFLFIFIGSRINCFVRAVSNDEEHNCTAFLNTYQDQILGTSIPTMPASGVSLKYCTISERTCCTVEVEEKLRDVSTNDFEKTIKKTLQNLSRTFKSKSTKLNEYFKDLLTQSKKDFHEMFKKTYGIVYEQNSYVFSDFFSELEKYFSHGKSHLPDVMDTFFNILYQKMFTVMNSQYKFDDKYLGCVSEHMNDLKPFGDVPPKLSIPLKRSFVAVRTYAQSLNIVGDIVSNLVNLVPADNCMNALLKMLHCSSCKGLTKAKVCNDFCLNVMKGCLAFHTEIDTEWNSFVDSLIKVQKRLLGPFNIELVVQPINVKISEAIMNFQENHAQISDKVFKGCGKPPLLDSRKRRRRRQVNGFSGSFDFPERNERGQNDRPGRRKKEKNDSNSNANNRSDKNKRKGSKDNVYDLDQYRTSSNDGFLKFIKEIGTQVAATRHFWKRLPHHVCADDMNVESNRSAVCWNGGGMGSYDTAVVSDGMKNQQNNPEVPVDARRHMTVVQEQMFALKSVSTQLKNAYDGRDVEWIDVEETFDAGSGSGYMPETDDADDFEPSVEGSGDSEYPTIFRVNGGDSTTAVNEFSENPLLRTLNTSGNTDASESAPASTSASTTASVGEGGQWTSIGPDANAKSTSFSSSSSSSSTSTTESGNILDSNNVNGTGTNGGTSVRYEKMSLNTAIASYLLPTVVIWIGGSFNDWFHTIASRN